MGDKIIKIAAYIFIAFTFGAPYLGVLLTLLIDWIIKLKEAKTK